MSGFSPLAGVDPHRRLRHAAEQGNREDQPPDGDAEEREPRGDAGIGEPEPFRLEDPGQVHRQQDAAAQVAERVPRARDAIHLGVGGDVRQQRVVEHEAARHADIADDEQRRGQPPVAAADLRHRRRAQHADAEEQSQQPLLGAGDVGVRPQHRRDDRDDGQRQRRRRGETLGRDRRRQVRGRHRREVDGEDRGDDRALERGVRPVVGRPRALLRRPQPESRQPSRDHQNVLRAIHSRIRESTTT